MAAWRDVLDLKTDQIASPQFAVDRKIEQRQIPCASAELEMGSDRPDMPGLQRWFLTCPLALVPGRSSGLVGSWFVLWGHGLFPCYET